MMKLLCEDVHDFLVKNTIVTEIDNEKHFVMKSTTLCKLRPISSSEIQHFLSKQPS